MGMIVCAGLVEVSHIIHKNKIMFAKCLILFFLLLHSGERDFTRRRRFVRNRPIGRKGMLFVVVVIRFCLQNIFI